MAERAKTEIGARDRLVMTGLVLLGLLTVIAGVLSGRSTIDYVLGMSGAGFKFLNPKATGQCGCGSSFAV